MLNVSNDFKTAISAPYRVIRGRCTLAYDYPFITGTVTSSTQNANSDRAKVVDGIGLSDYYNDGKFRGFQSSATCNASNVFTTAQTLTVSFAETNISQAQVVGDNKTGQYPVDFSIKATRQVTLNSSKLVGGEGLGDSGENASSSRSVRTNDYYPVKAGDVITITCTNFSTYVFTVRAWTYNTSYVALSKVYEGTTGGTYTITQDGFIRFGWFENNLSAYTNWIGAFSQVYTNTITNTVTNNALMKYVYTFSNRPITSLLLTIGKWSAPSTTAKITAFTYRNTETFTGDDIIKMDITEEIEPEGGTVFGTAIAKKAEVTLSNFADKFTNVQFLANRAFYPEYGADLTMVGLSDVFGINADIDLEVDEDYTIASDTTWELEADKDLTVEDVEVGDYELIDNIMFAEFDSLPQRIEWCPMGIYYTDDWKLSDDRYSLSIQGLDAIGYSISQPFIDDITVFASHDERLEEYFSQTVPAYTFERFTGLTPSISYNGATSNADIRLAMTNLPTRDSLSKIYTLSICIFQDALSAGFAYGLAYTTTSKYTNKIILKPKANIIYDDTGDSDYLINSASYFKAKNYRNDANLYNTFIGVYIDGLTTGKGEIAARISQEGTVLYKFDLFYSLSVSRLQGLYAEQQSESSVEWQGNPALELGDNIDLQITTKGNTVSHKGYLVSNHYKFSGGLRCTSRIKVLETEEVT